MKNYSLVVVSLAALNLFAGSALACQMPRLNTSATAVQAVAEYIQASKTNSFESNVLVKRIDVLKNYQVRVEFQSSPDSCYAQRFAVTFDASCKARVIPNSIELGELCLK